MPRVLRALIDVPSFRTAALWNSKNYKIYIDGIFPLCSIGLLIILFVLAAL